jgi:hypothetical protein
MRACHPFQPAQRGRHLPPTSQREVPHHITGMRKRQLINHYESNDRPMRNGDRAVFGFPCRFPAAPSIRPKIRLQDID